MSELQNNVYYESEHLKLLFPMPIILHRYHLVTCHSTKIKALWTILGCRLAPVCRLSLLALSWVFSLWNLILGWSPKVCQDRILLNPYFFIIHAFLAIKFDTIQLKWMLHLKHSLYGAKSLKLCKVDQKYLKSFEMWCYRMMENVSGTNLVKN
jgi:hypothetical protein